MDIVEFLTARYDEEQRLAETAASQASFIAVPDNDEGDPGRWCATEDDSGVTTENAYSGEPFLLMPQGYVESVIVGFIATNDPARVLADIAAKRGVIHLYREERGLLSARGHNAEGESRLWLLEAVLRRLAAPFEQHPDFDPAWAVSE